jgi:hypothetical protein
METKVVKKRKSQTIANSFCANQKVLRVKITKCSNEWYAKHVGKLTRVVDFTANQYLLVQNITPEPVTLLKADCQIL